jgi:hypothetical protein
MLELLDKIRQILCNIFHQGFGDPKDSQAGDYQLPADNIWHPLLTMEYPCILYLRNTTAFAQEIQLTWNKELPVGGRIAFGLPLILDKVIGTLYVKVGNPLLTGNINFMAVAIKHSDQNV